MTVIELFAALCINAILVAYAAVVFRWSPNTAFIVGFVSGTVLTASLLVIFGGLS